MADKIQATREEFKRAFKAPLIGTSERKSFCEVMRAYPEEAGNALLDFASTIENEKAVNAICRAVNEITTLGHLINADDAHNIQGHVDRHSQLMLAGGYIKAIADEHSEVDFGQLKPILTRAFSIKF